MWSELLQPLIALVQILLLSRDRISNHFDHRFDDEAASDDDDSQRRPIFFLGITMMTVFVITSLVIIISLVHTVNCCSRLSQIMFQLSLLLSPFSFPSSVPKCHTLSCEAFLFFLSQFGEHSVQFSPLTKKRARV